MNKYRTQLLDTFAAGLEAVKGDNAVYNALVERDDLPDCHVIAIGKAAEAMYQGAKRYLETSIKSAILISKYDHFSTEIRADPRLILLEAAHPVPADSSLAAGQQLLDYLQKLPANEPCLFLISGGSSSLCEVLEGNWTLEQLQALTKDLLADGYDIHAMNAIRQRISAIKGGKLWRFIGNRPVWALLISDVEGDDPVSIGSGLLFPPEQDKVPKRLPEKWQQQLPPFTQQQTPGDFQWELVASNDIALTAMQQHAQHYGYPVTVMPRFLNGNAGHEAKACIDTLRTIRSGMLLWGGETTVRLPDNPGRGGRNQHLALTAATHIAGDNNIYLLAGGTDGSDGLSPDAGALVDGKTCERGSQMGRSATDSLNLADSGPFLEDSGDLLNTGPTGTNVMDVLIGLKV